MREQSFYRWPIHLNCMPCNSQTHTYTRPITSHTHMEPAISITSTEIIMHGDHMHAFDNRIRNAEPDGNNRIRARVYANLIPINRRNHHPSANDPWRDCVRIVLTRAHARRASSHETPVDSTILTWCVCVADKYARFVRFANLSYWFNQERTFAENN